MKANLRCIYEQCVTKCLTARKKKRKKEQKQKQMLQRKQMSIFWIYVLHSIFISYCSDAMQCVPIHSLQNLQNNDREINGFIVKCKVIMDLT